MSVAIVKRERHLHACCADASSSVCSGFSVTKSTVF
jgi:predicted DNA-binding protein with PD1-like motif